MQNQFHRNISEFIADKQNSDWHNKTLWYVRAKRDIAKERIPNWEEIRDIASKIKESCLSNLGKYLRQFEENATKNGIKVHWAKDADEHNEIVYQILSLHGVKKIVKSKSMLTEECGLNESLIQRDIEVIDTDLGERIIQLKNEPPSHIVMPAIHLKKEDISDLFHKKLNTDKGNNDPEYLTHQARIALRNEFLSSDASLTGVNFAIANTGEIVICTNEGNADLGINLVKLQIHSMGIEKIVPKRKDLGIFISLLARSATGQDITVYTSHIRRPTTENEIHVILVDNGRSERLYDANFKKSLKCIRCGACLNTCPVYRRIGGHSYGVSTAGPIGSILSPATDLRKYNNLAFASTLCGSCSDVCPVKVDIHKQLYKWRQIAGKQKMGGLIKDYIMSLFATFLRYNYLYKIGFKFAKAIVKHLPENLIYNRFNTWGRNRNMPKFK